MFSMFLPLVNGQLKAINYWPQAKKVQGDTVRMSCIMEAPLEVTADAAEATASFQGGDIVLMPSRLPTVITGAAQCQLCGTEGKSMVIVGLYGSGKSTILNLVERLYEPSAGEIRVGKPPSISSTSSTTVAISRMFSRMPASSAAACARS